MTTPLRLHQRVSFKFMALAVAAAALVALVAAGRELANLMWCPRAHCQ
jgi:hypothetical protein